MRSGATSGGALETVCPLARGGMGRVENAVRREGRFERLYAVKRLLVAHAHDDRYRAMFLDEARIAGLLRHANVVPVLDVGEDARGPFMVMEYVDSLTLSQVIAHHREHDELLPVQLGVAIGAMVANGLHAAHELRDARGKSLHVVHRDLSPQNVLLGFDGVVRVTDFGVAAGLDREALTATGVLKGKLGYMSPEQLRYEELDRRSDLFSLGVLLYELLSGRRLYSDGSSSELARRILHDPPPDLDDARRDAPPALVELLFRLFAKDRDARPATAREVAWQLERMLTDLRAEEGPLSLADYMTRVFVDAQTRRRRRIEAGLRVLDRQAGLDRQEALGRRAPDLETGAPSPSGTPRDAASAPTKATPARALASAPPSTRPARTGPTASSAASGSARRTTGPRARVVYAEGSNVLAVHGNLIIQVRAGSISHPVLEAFEAHFERIQRRYDRGAYIGVLEPGAEVPPADVRAHQKRLITRQLRQADVRLAVAIRGDGIPSSLTRSVVRVLVPSSWGVKITADVPAAIAWVRPNVGAPFQPGLGDAVQQAIDAIDRA